jgi:hypothetical protein
VNFEGCMGKRKMDFFKDVLMPSEHVDIHSFEAEKLAILFE